MTLPTKAAEIAAASMLAAGLTAKQRIAVRAIDSKGNSPWGYTAAECGVAGATMMSLCADNRIGRQGLVQYMPDRGNGRSLYRLTPLGRAVAHQLAGEKRDE